MMNRRVVLLSMLAALSLMLTNCATLQTMLEQSPKPTASLRDVAFKNVSFTSVSLQFEVEVSNPYEVPLPLVNLDYGLSSGQSKLLKGMADVQGSIPAKQSKVLSLPVSVSFADVLGFAQGVRSGTTIPYAADVKLGVTAPGIGRFAIPMGKSGQIAVPSVPGL